MFLATIFVFFISFPNRKDSVFTRENSKLLEISASGSIGMLRNDKCAEASPNETLISYEMIEWCSNIVEDKKDPKKNPWIQYSIKGKQMKNTGFAIRNGCCRYPSCYEENGKTIDSYTCYNLYSYSL